VTVRVPAKINLQLGVGPLRPDGYHGLVTVFHAVSLFDEVTVATDEADSVTVSGEGAGLVPENGDNLALRAVRTLRQAIAKRARVSSADDVTGTAVIRAPEFPAPEIGRAPDVGGVSVTIAKRIPVAGGMAGGSADAAAALVACNELWETGLSPGELCTVAGEVGSDVAFAVLGGTVIGRGRGEQLTPVQPAAPAMTYHWVLAFADGHLSTPTVFHALDKQRKGREVAEPGLSSELMRALGEGDQAKVGAALSNDLQESALMLFPALRKTLDAGLEAGALGALVSGSGPTCFFLARDEAGATALAAGLSASGACRSVVTATGPAAGASVISK
jgi:4-diphosphocytidyl-2-C-methyl-D-erythritol kinase